MPRPDAALALERLLDAMHLGILAGDLAGLAAQEAEIDALLLRLPGLTDLPLANRLRRKAERNASCLMAAARGIRSAQRRVAEIRAARGGLATYDGSGKRLDAPLAGGGLTRRV